MSQRYLEVSVERAIIRQALSQADDIGGYGPLAEVLGFTPVAHAIDYLSDPMSEVARRLAPVAVSMCRVGAFESGSVRAGLWVAVLPEWGGHSSARSRPRRRLAKTLVELAPAGDRNVLLVLTADESDDIEMVLPRRRSDGSLGTVRTLVSRSSPTRHHLELLESLILEPGDETAVISRRWAGAFNVERVTKSFYLEFRALRDRLVEVLKSENPTNALLAVTDDETAESDLRRYVTRNLGRVLFLWFIQAKGWLDGDPHYLLNLYNTHCRGGADKNFYREALIPLFFDGLARKPEDRTKSVRSLGDLPYLDGGLFIQTAFEDQLYGEQREHVSVVLPNWIFDPRAHDSKSPTVLGLLSSYRFTTRESTPDDQSLDPDPELLGKVFENLNEDRKKSGTYYTPREVVRFMCRAALDGYLRDVVGVSGETLDALRLEALDPAATDIRMSAKERMRLEKALLEVTVCDPAVGSGAFPVGMLQEIIQLLIGIEQSADVSVAVGGQRVAEWKEKVITNCLYGVDINPEAVEICHLRLWLSMVIDADRPVPLPNLDFRFEAGDSLVDRLAELPLSDSLPRETQSGLALGGVSDALRKLEDLRAEYVLMDDPGEARRLRDAVKQAQLDAVRIEVCELITQCKSAVKGQRTKLNEMRRLGAKAAQTRKAQKQADDLAKRIKVLKGFSDHLSPDAPYKKPFLWPVEFPEVFERGGFDIIVANPPYVRQEKLAPEDQQAYAASFPEVHTGTADLLVYFFARATQIMKDEGHLAFITSNKFHRSGYGEGLREYLPGVMTIDHVVDFGDLEVFDAIAYPSIIIGTKKRPEARACTSIARLNNVVRRAILEAGAVENVSTVREQLDDLEGLLERNGIPDFPQVLLKREGWVLEKPDLVRLFDRLMSTGKPLAEFVQERMYYGIKTGLNEAFVIDEAKRVELIDADPRSEELIKTWLRGRDVKRWRPQWGGLYLVAIQNSGDAGNENPWRNATAEREALAIFEESYPALYNHLMGFKKVLRSRADQGRWWWELRACTYYAEFKQPKVVWATITPEPRFLWDAGGFYVNDKGNIIADVDQWIVGVLNSTLMYAFGATRLMPERQRGFYEWKPKPVGLLPIVVPDRNTQEALSAAVDSSTAAPGAHDSEVDELVMTVYGVTDTERKLLEECVDQRRIGADAEGSEDD